MRGRHKVVYNNVEGWLFGMDIYEINKEGVKILYDNPNKSMVKSNSNNNESINNTHESNNNNQGTSTAKTIFHCA